MTVHTDVWAPGTPCWADLMTTDPAAAREFYAGLFGWQIEVGSEEFGGYSMANLQGHSVAGIGAMMGMEHPPVWSTYLATADVAATCAAVEKAGGSVFAPPMDVMDAGKMAFVQAPGGGFTGLWQAGTHTGFDLANEPGAVTWNEFMGRDYDTAKRFFADVFGYTYSEMGDGSMQYSMIEVDGTTVGGLGTLPDAVPAQVPPHWRTYFTVEDADATAEKAVSLGGSVLRPPTDMPFGRFADVADPQGAMFSIVKPPAGPDA